MDDLVTWLGEQLDADEHAALTWPEGRRRWALAGQRTVRYDNGGDKTMYTVNVNDDPPQWEQIRVMRATAQEVDHIVRWDPTRVLAEVEAKRAILRMHEPVGVNVGFQRNAYTACVRDDDRWPCADVRALALPYADRPGYRPNWTPST